MRALTSLDSMFIAAEDGRTVTNVSSLAIMDRADVNGNPLTRNARRETSRLAHTDRLDARRALR